MSLLSEIFAIIGAFAVNTISALGYFGIFFLMMLESMIVPIPSELVMPFAGFLVAKGEFSFAFVILFSSLGSILGSLLSYYIGMYGGEKAVLRFGRYIFLDETDLKKTEAWFKKSGEKTIFIGRLIPVVRHLISVPAGIGKMDLKKFCIYTIIGATIWNTFLAYLGYVLGKNWDKVRQFTEPISIVVAAVLVAGFVFFVFRHVQNKREYRKNSKQ
jgi:membrane protein DedA with SNARE-associated domain